MCWGLGLQRTFLGSHDTSHNTSFVFAWSICLFIFNLDHFVPGTFILDTKYLSLYREFNWFIWVLILSSYFTPIKILYYDFSFSLSLILLDWSVGNYASHHWDEIIWTLLIFHFFYSLPPPSPFWDLCSEFNFYLVGVLPEQFL